MLDAGLVHAAIGGLLGLLVGSFLNVVIHRLPKMMERDWRADCAELSGEAAPQASADRAARGAADSGRALFWRLIVIYHLASFIAVSVSMMLGLLGLEFTGRQWLLFWAGVPFGVAFFTSIDVVAMRRHLKPLAPVRCSTMTFCPTTGLIASASRRRPNPARRNRLPTYTEISAVPS